MAEKLTRWMIFGVIITVLPLFVSLLEQAARHGKPSLSLVTAHGELLLISSAIAAAAVGELFGSGANYRLRKIAAGGCCVIVFFICTSWFADVASPAPTGELIDRQFVSAWSLVLFILSLISSASCVALSEY